MDFTKTTFRVYEIVQPSETWVHKEKYDQLKLELPGFKKEDIRVKFTNGTTLEISGERLLVNKKWSSFKKDYLTPENCVTDEIRASFDDGSLHVTMPKFSVTFHEEEKRNDITTNTTTSPEMIADNISEKEKKKASSTNSTITDMTDDAMSVTHETEKDVEHVQNEGKDVVNGVKESQSDFVEDAIGIKKLDADDTTEYAVNQIELVLNMFAASFVILMLVTSAT